MPFNLCTRVQKFEFLTVNVINSRPRNVKSYAKRRAPTYARALRRVRCVVREAGELDRVLRFNPSISTSSRKFRIIFYIILIQTTRLLNHLNSCYAMLCYVMLCHVMSCPAMPCYVMLCYLIRESKGSSIKYVTQFWTNFDPSFCHTLSHISGPP